MPRVLLALGSNLGDRGAILDAAIAAIGELTSTQVLAHSKWHATKPVGGPPGQGDFLNGAVLIETELAPGELRRKLQQIEQKLGRERTERWAARTLDIDILLYDDQIIDQPDLQIPHPRMSFRPFVLAPAAEVAAEMVHPVLGVTIGALWHHLQFGDDLVAICGGLTHDRFLMMGLLLNCFPNRAFESSAGLQSHQSRQWQLLPALRVRERALAIDIYLCDQIGISKPKLQIQFSIPNEEFAQFMATHGRPRDQKLWRRLHEHPEIPNAMSRLFTGIPTLMLDPRKGPLELQTEAAAALEAVWPDLCRTGA